MGMPEWLYMICGGCLLGGGACVALYDLWWGTHFVGMPAWLYMICGGVFTLWGCLLGFI